MRQGTTPTHTFSIPVEAALVDSIYFKAGIECLIQVRFTTVSGEAFASQIISESVDGVIKGGEI